MKAMTRRDFVPIAAAGACVSAGRAQVSGRRPNIVLIMADDMGFSDLGCYGSEIETPNLDRLAKGGLQFTQFANAARCCPTRASLLTGLYPHQAGVGHMVDDRGLPGYRGQLNDRCVTIAEALKPAGYQTAMVGKWHVSRLAIEGKDQLNFQSDKPFYRSQECWPKQRGFDRFYGTIAGVNNFFDPFSLVEGNEMAGAPPRDFYYTDAITHLAEQYIGELSKSEAPFFLYIAHTSPHWPLHALETEIRKYRNTYKKGWDEVRRERYQRLVKAGLIDPKWKLTPRDASVPPWTEAPHQEWEAERMAVYAAMIDRLDQGIGRVMRRLQSVGKERDTLVLFLSDNGGCAENVQPEWYDIPSKTRDGKPIHVGNSPGVTPGPETTWLSYGPAWANVSNTPFRSYKHWVFEGGTATPLIAHWPAGIEPGRVTHAPGHVIDLMATSLDLAGAKYPATTPNGAGTVALQGKSLTPVLKGAGREGHEFLYWEHEGNRAIRQGDWKLVSSFGRTWELYDLRADRTEMNDVAAKLPRRVQQLSTEWEEWAKRSNVEPWETVRAAARARSAKAPK
jgi:arylsulfatase